MPIVIPYTVFRAVCPITEMFPVCELNFTTAVKWIHSPRDSDLVVLPDKGADLPGPVGSFR